MVAQPFSAGTRLTLVPEYKKPFKIPPPDMFFYCGRGFHSGHSNEWVLQHGVLQQDQVQQELCLSGAVAFWIHLPPRRGFFLSAGGFFERRGLHLQDFQLR